MQVNSVSPNSTAVNSKALISIKNRGYFNPAQSRSSYKLLNAFENESYGIKTLCDLYDVKAVFTTKWFKEHPLYDIDNCEWDFKGSYAQLDLIVKRIKEYNGFWDRIKGFFEPWQKVSIGEYSDFDTDMPLADAEERLATVVRNIDYPTIKGHLDTCSPDEIMLDKADEYRSYGYL